MHSASTRVKGFTLIEMMVVVAIIAILAAIALPSYRDYVIRGYLVDGTNQLAAQRAKMEQYYQDARTYATSGAYKSPCDNAVISTLTVKNWTFTCTGVAAATYTIVATGSGPVAGAIYWVDQTNAQTTKGLPAGWTVPSPATCWVISRGGTC
ncbi:MAG: prepilin-type N-terminal cleavage/methylation domain-containing protein [Proteobacteria bacterium]|uniref:type IV pilin protein n=1 Tax=Rudaea sp. TaxID=2136325 RepID=UPI003783F74F|nr:prepilin-type N-terminal cleavage/methylation domain-containing protein [Pseudomonadota bacterium]